MSQTGLFLGRVEFKIRSLLLNIYKFRIIIDSWLIDLHVMFLFITDNIACFNAHFVKY